MYEIYCPNCLRTCSVSKQYVQNYKFYVCPWCYHDKCSTKEAWFNAKEDDKFRKLNSRKGRW